MPKSYPAWIDEYAEAFSSSFRHHDVRVHMPFNGWDYYPIFADLWIQKLDEAIRTIETAGFSIDEIAHRLPPQPLLKFKLAEAILCAKSAKIEYSTVRHIVDFFIRVISAKTCGDSLWRNNLVHEFEDVGRIADEKKLVPASREYASEIGKIITGAGTLAHGLYNDFCCDIGFMAYGPYDATDVFGDGAILVIRSFDDLNPIELWPDHKSFPYKKIRIFTVYKNVEAVPTYVSSQMLYKGNLHDNLAYFQVDVDGALITDLAELKTIREKLLETASSLYVETLAYDFEKQKEFWLSQLCYDFKQLFDLAGVDWRPSLEMTDRVKDKELIPTIQTYEMPQEEFYEKFGVEYLKNAYAAIHS